MQAEYMRWACGNVIANHLKPADFIFGCVGNNFPLASQIIIMVLFWWGNFDYKKDPERSALMDPATGKTINRKVIKEALSGYFQDSINKSAVSISYAGIVSFCRGGPNKAGNKLEPVARALEDFGSLTKVLVGGLDRLLCVREAGIVDNVVKQFLNFFPQAFLETQAVVDFLSRAPAAHASLIKQTEISADASLLPYMNTILQNLFYRIFHKDIIF
jgi:hypothetical protein